MNRSFDEVEIPVLPPKRFGHVVLWDLFGFSGVQHIDSSNCHVSVNTMGQPAPSQYQRHCHRLPFKVQSPQMILETQGRDVTSPSGQVCHLFVQLSLSWFYWFIVIQVFVVPNFPNSFWEVCWCSSELVTSLILTVSMFHLRNTKIESWELKRLFWGVNSKYRSS